MKTKVTIIFLVLLLTSIACDKKKQINKEKEVNEQINKLYKRNEELSKGFPIEENILDKLNYVFEKGFEFEKGVTVEKIGLLEVEENIYKTVVVLGKDVNFERLQDLAFYMKFYPSDPILLDIEKEKKQGYIKSGVKVRIKKMGDKFVIINNECRIIPKNHKAIRYYFYDMKLKIVLENLVLNNIALN